MYAGGSDWAKWQIGRDGRGGRKVRRGRAAAPKKTPATEYQARVGAIAKERRRADAVKQCQES